MPSSHDRQRFIPTVVTVTAEVSTLRRKICVVVVIPAFTAELAAPLVAIVVWAFKLHDDAAVCCPEKEDRK